MERSGKLQDKTIPDLLPPRDLGGMTIPGRWARSFKGYSKHIDVYSLLKTIFWNYSLEEKETSQMEVFFDNIRRPSLGLRFLISDIRQLSSEIV